MRALELAVQDGIGGTGMLAVLEGAKPAKTLLIRADTDAVPMEEPSNCDHASKIKSHNHCCGHDPHSAIVAGFGSAGAASRAHHGTCGVRLPASRRTHARREAHDRGWAARRSPATYHQSPYVL